MRTAALSALSLLLAGCHCTGAARDAGGAGSDAAPGGDAGASSADAAATDAGPPPPPPSEICARPVDLADVSAPTTVVGDGTPALCTESALAAAVAAGGVVTFDCGAAPVTIPVTAEIVVAADTILDGGGLVTLDGGGATRIMAIHATFDVAGPYLTVQRLAFANGRASGTATPLGTDLDGGGGAIFHEGGTVTAIDCTFTANHAADTGPDVGGGAIYGLGVGATTAVGCTFSANTGSNGGAIGVLFNSLTIVNSTLDANVATGFGANYVDPGTGMQAGSGGNGGAVAMDGQGATLTICGSSFTNNRGGAIGGAVFRTSYESEPTDIDRSTFDGNAIEDHLNEPGETSLCGGLYLQGTSVTITDSTISDNIATGTGGLWVNEHGAAPGSLDMTNVTVANNAVYEHPALGDTGLAGGIWVGDGVTGTLLNCTIAGNFAQFGAGITGIEPLVLLNTIVANTSSNLYVPINCTNLPPGAGAPASGMGNLQWPMTNLAGDDFLCATGVTFGDPLLGALADNGGPTRTLLPAAGSPAIGLGSACPPADQRGNPRGEPCAAGAVEP